MGMMQALAMLGAGANGYLQGTEQLRQQKRQDEADARVKVMQGREDAQYKQTQGDEQAARDAMAPVQANPLYPTGDDEGNAAPAFEQKYTVAGAPGVMGQAEASTAAEAQNALPARMAKAAAAVQNPILAAKLGVDAQSAQVNAMQLAQANRVEANRVFDEGLKGALRKGQQALAGFMSDLPADGQGGAVKFQAVTAPDGTWQMLRLTPDGKQTPFGGKYAADDNGMAEAGFALSRGVTDESKLTHALAVKKESREKTATDNLG